MTTALGLFRYIYILLLHGLRAKMSSFFIETERRRTKGIRRKTKSRRGRKATRRAKKDRSKQLASVEVMSLKY